jgi:hypothetical protein
MTINYIEYLYPGSFFAESSEVPVAERVLPLPVQPRVAGYRFFSRTEVQTTDGEKLVGPKHDFSPWVYFGHEYSAKEIGVVHGTASILYQNIAGNGYERAVKTIFGNWYPLSPGEIVVTPSGA